MTIMIFSFAVTSGLCDVSSHQAASAGRFQLPCGIIRQLTPKPRSGRHAARRISNGSIWTALPVSPSSYSIFPFNHLHIMEETLPLAEMDRGDNDDAPCNSGGASTSAPKGATWQNVTPIDSGDGDGISPLPRVDRAQMDLIHEDRGRGQNAHVQPQIFSAAGGLRELLVRDAVKGAPTLAAPLLRLNAANLGSALIKPFSRVLDVILNAAMAVPVPLLVLMGYMSMGHGNWQGALRYLDPALPRARGGRYEILILQAIGTCHEWLGEESLALEYLTETTELALSTPRAMYAGPIAVASASTCILLLVHSWKCTEAEEFYTRYHDRCMALMDQPLPGTHKMPLENMFKQQARGWMTRNATYVLVGLGRLEDAVDNMRSLLQFKEVKSNDLEHCKVQINLADILVRLGHKVEATELLSVARKRATTSKKIDDKSKLMLLTDISLLTYLGLHDPAAAEKDLALCLELAEREYGAVNSYGADLHTFLGECQELLGRPSEAAESFRKGGKIFGALETNSSPCWEMLLETRAHSLLGDLSPRDIHVLLLRMVETYNERRKDRWTQRLLANCYLQAADLCGNVDNARTNLERALEMVELQKHLYRGTFNWRMVTQAVAMGRKVEAKLAVLPRVLESSSVVQGLEPGGAV